MKRTGFRKKTFEEVIKKAKEKNKAPRTKLPTIKTLRNKADSKLTPIIKAMYPKCLLCPHQNPPRNNPTEVAHHHVHKSKSSALRYEVDNLVNLCHQCHLALHNNESYWASVIVRLRGIQWFEMLEEKKNVIIKADRFWYESHIIRLDNILKNLHEDF